ncbi:hypothetical protein HXX76_015403 [Chlamydomonas incerta]|uniref:SnoaL-like domain-containing protein n=1 Tax=Chlamydomonas incerta TaxID=51695 RepID=A0A835VPW4_CHLIN|nr:hypothetical protein HXX76_015403 [Chlamydomonas incerta]|eukprot:KAG2423355.1 hypothetical protein HXX76_015403 [Chlamydomonas incerta]
MTSTSASGHQHQQRIACSAYVASLPDMQGAQTATVDAAVEASAISHATGTAATVVLRFIGALNARDLSGMLQLVSEDCHHVDLSHEHEGHCKEDVARFYADVVASMPEKVQVVVDDITGGDDSRAGVMWHMEVDGMEVPCSRGLSFYRVSPSARTITYVRQSPEHFVKAGGVVLSATASATPLIDSLGPMALPNFWTNLARGASNMLASAPPMEEMLRSLAAAGAANTVPQVLGGAVVSSMMPHQPAPGQSAGQSCSYAASGFAAAPRPPTAPTSAAASVASSVTAAAAAAADAGLAAATAAAGARASPVVCAAAVMVDAPTATTTSTSNGSNGTGNGRYNGNGGGASLAAAATAASAAAAAGTRAAASHAAAASRTSSGQQPIVMVPLGPAPTAKTASPTAAAASSPTAAPPAMSTASVMESEVTVEVTVEVQQQQQKVPAAPAVAVEPSCLTGIWEKDLEASDVGGYEKALDLWQISGVQKATARLIEGLELAHTPGGRPALNVHFLTIIPYFKVTEVYPMTPGTRSKMRRRDQRGGDALACAERVATGVVCRATWGAPFAGDLEESYTIPDPVGAPDCMHVTSTIRVGDKAATTLQVYHRRRNMSAAQLISASEKRNGNAHDVLKRFGM